MTVEPAPEPQPAAPAPAAPAPQPAAPAPGQQAPDGYTGVTVDGVIPPTDGSVVEAPDGYSDEFGVWHPAP